MSEHPKANSAISRLEAAMKEDTAFYHCELMDVARCQLGNLLSEIEQLESELDISKSFHELAVKERDLERLKVDRLNQGIAEMINATRELCVENEKLKESIGLCSGSCRIIP